MQTKGYNEMNIIIVGCGKVGIELVRHLCRENHDIVVIDENKEKVEDLINDYDIMGICGNGACCDTLEEANVEKCSIFIATTASDELNILCCMVARKMKARHCIARVRNPSYAEQLVFMREELGLSMMVNPEYQAAEEIARILHYPSAINIESFGRGRVDLAEFAITEDNILNGQALSSMSTILKMKVLICAVQRGEEIYIPDGTFVLRAGDKIHFTAAHDQLPKFFRAVNAEQNRVKTVLLIGGGKVSYYLAQMLSEEHSMKVKLIEIDKERCVALSDNLPNTEVIYGDGSDQDILLEEGITRMDACVTLTGIDEENIILSMYAKKMGVRKVITKVNRLTLYSILNNNFELGSIVSPKAITANMILQYVRARQNSGGSNIMTLYRLVDEKVEAIEFSVAHDASYVGVPLQELKLRKNLLIASIIRGKQQIIPNGKDIIMVHDSVVVVTTNQFMQDLKDIFEIG